MASSLSTVHQQHRVLSTLFCHSPQHQEESRSWMNDLNASEPVLLLNRTHRAHSACPTSSSTEPLVLQICSPFLPDIIFPSYKGTASSNSGGQRKKTRKYIGGQVGQATGLRRLFYLHLALDEAPALGHWPMSEPGSLILLCSYGMPQSPQISTHRTLLVTTIDLQGWRVH